MKEIAPEARLALAAARVPSVDKRRPDPAELREKCRQFEAIFVESMFKSMRATIPESGLLEKGTGTEIFAEMRDAEVARQMTRGQGLGLAEALFRQLRKVEGESGGEDEAGSK